jgi:hypothetical protein
MEEFRESDRPVSQKKPCSISINTAKSYIIKMRIVTCFATTAAQRGERTRSDFHARGLAPDKPETIKTVRSWPTSTTFGFSAEESIVE